MDPIQMQRDMMIILSEALEYEGEEREAWLRERCADAPEMLIEVKHRLGRLDDTLFAGEEEVNPNALVAGQQIGPYTIVAELDSGGMGNVYSATHPFQGTVALKVLKRGLDSRKLIRRFHQERRILAQLTHPNIARILDGGETPDGRPYFAMEYVDGRPINRWCDEQKLTIDQRLDLFARICDAVDDAHMHMVVHRDIKPGNIMVDKTGEPKLLDFGIARILDANEDDDVTLTAVGMRPMTPEYASPQQIQGEPAAVSCDVYSLGVLLYELLTGHRPYQITSRNYDDVRRVLMETTPVRPSEIILSRREINRVGGKVVELTPESVSVVREGAVRKLRNKLSGDLDKIVLMALRKEPERRYRSAIALADDVRAYLSGLPVQANHDGFSYKARKFAARNKMLLAVMAALLLAPISFYTAWYRQLNKREQDLIRLEASSEALQIIADLSKDMMEVQSDKRKGDRVLNIGELLVSHLERVESVDSASLVESGRAEPLVNAMLRLGDMLCETGHHQYALRAYLKSAEIAGFIKDPYIIGITNGNYANELKEQQDFVMARKYCDIAVNSLHTLPANESSVWVFTLSLDLAGQRGDFESAECYELLNRDALLTHRDHIYMAEKNMDLLLELGNDAELNSLVAHMEETVERHYGKADPRYLYIRHFEANALYYQGYLDEAAAIAEEVAIQVLVNESFEAQRLYTVSRMAELLIHGDQLELGEALLTELDSLNLHSEAGAAVYKYARGLLAFKRGDRQTADRLTQAAFQAQKRMSLHDCRQLLFHYYAQLKYLMLSNQIEAAVQLKREMTPLLAANPNVRLQIQNLLDQLPDPDPLPRRAANLWTGCMSIMDAD